jgi:hypothetical protein
VPPSSDHEPASQQWSSAVDVWLGAATYWYLTGLLVALGFSFGFYFVRPAGGAVPEARDWADAFNWMDGRWYKQIAAEGYEYDPGKATNIAFFPVYPIFGRAVVSVTGWRAEAALLIVSNLLLLAALAMLAFYVRDRYPDGRADLAGYALLAAALFPTGCFFRLTYSESTFLLLAVLAMYAMLRRWPLCAVALIIGLATATRPVGVALLAPLAIHILRRSAHEPEAPVLTLRYFLTRFLVKNTVSSAPSAVFRCFSGRSMQRNLGKQAVSSAKKAQHQKAPARPIDSAASHEAPARQLAEAGASAAAPHKPGEAHLPSPSGRGKVSATARRPRGSPHLRFGSVCARLALYLPLACWGLAVFMAYQHHVFGEPLAFIKIQKHWGTPAPWGEKAIALATLVPVRSVYDDRSPAYWANHDPHGIPWFSLQFANPIFFVGAVALVALGAWRRDTSPPALGHVDNEGGGVGYTIPRSRRADVSPRWLSPEETALSALLLMIPYVTRAYEMNMGSMARFVAVVFPIYLVLGQLLIRLPGPARVAILSLSGFSLGIYAALYAARYDIF